MSLLLLLAPAWGGVPVAWNWPTAAPLKFHLETTIYTPRGIRYNSKENLDAIAVRTDLVVDADCQAKAEGKGWLVNCSFAYVKVAGDGALPDDDTEMPRILDEWSAGLKGARVEWVTTTDGKMRVFDLKGISGYDSRTNYIVEQQRALLSRAFSLFDLPVTTSDDDWKRGWLQKGGNFLQLYTLSGTAGASELRHKPQGVDSGLWAIQSAGNAVLTPSAALDSEGAALIDVRVQGTTYFDTNRGVIEYRDATFDGRRTASSVDVGSDADYFQISALQRVDAFLPEGQAPPSVLAQRAPKVNTPPPELPAGVSLVPFAELGMSPLFIPSMPAEARPLKLATTKVGARVLVGPDGVPTSATVTSGYTILAETARLALLGARFPARPAPYAVDVEVEFRAAN